jgi:hypothetical protein
MIFLDAERFKEAKITITLILVNIICFLVAIENRSLLPFTLIYIVYFIAASFMPGINIWAHIFGLLGGILCGFVFYYRRKDFTRHY